MVLRNGVLFGLLVTVVATAAEESRPDLDHFRSRYVEIAKQTLSTSTNLLPPTEERTASDVLARIGLSIANKSRRPIWIAVRLTPPPPNDPCPRGTGRLDPKDEIEFRCTQESLVADEDYPLDITVFADSALTDTLERNGTFIRFDMVTVQWMEERLAARRQELEEEKHPTPEPSGIRLRESFGYAFTVSLSGGVVLPAPKFADRYGTGGMGATTFGITGRRFGVRLLVGSTEPAALDATDADYSARLGRAVHVMLAIVPVELQAVATLPSQTSRLAAVLQAGAGLHSVTVRIKDTDDRIDEDQRFGFSAGAGLRYGLTPPDRTHTIAASVNGIFHGSGSDRYATVELEVTLVW